MREGRKVTMGRYSRKQSACAGKESAEDFGKWREDQREISAHLQLNYANTPPCGCAGVTFLLSLIHPLYAAFICLHTIWITLLNYPVQLDFANTHPFRCVGGVLFYSLLFVHCTNLYWLPIIWITPFNPIMQIPPCRCGGILYTFFFFRRSTLYIFLLPLYGDFWGFPIISAAQNNLVP